MASETQLATTVSGSRTFANAFLIKWTPSETQSQLKVEITAGGSLLTINTFTPDNATQPVEGSNNTYSVQGTVVAMFNFDGMSGSLISIQLNMVANGNTTPFTGTIGVW